MRTLVGSYRLVEWTFRIDAEVARHPFGRNAEGRLTYTDDGRMWALLAGSDRAPLGSRYLAEATATQLAEAARSFVTYCGTYREEPGSVVHYVEASLFPDWVGTEQRRLVTWIGSDLVLTTPPTRLSSGPLADNVLRWERMGPARPTTRHETEPHEEGAA